MYPTAQIIHDVIALLHSGRAGSDLMVRPAGGKGRQSADPISVSCSRAAAWWHAALTTLLLSTGAVAQDDAPTPASLPTPEWAIPKEGPPPPPPENPDRRITQPGSDLSLTQEEIDNRFDTPDWYPDEHEPMPRIVKHGNEPDNWACAMCHLASGAGHPQSAKLAGHSTEYLERQLQAFKVGDRNSYLGDFIDNLHSIADPEDARLAAEWFASLEPVKHQTVIETDRVPETTFYGTSFMRVVANDADGEVNQEALNGRIIEVPEDYAAVKARSPRGHFLTYVPEGSIEKGENIAQSGKDGLAPCTSCHGPELKGTALGPALAGSFPTYTVRQLYDFRNGKRTGLADQTGYMSASSRLLTPEDIVNLAAYIGSLEP